MSEDKEYLFLILEDKTKTSGRFENWLKRCVEYEREHMVGTNFFYTNSFEFGEIVKSKFCDGNNRISEFAFEREFWWN